MVRILTTREIHSLQRLASRLDRRGMAGEAEMLRAILRAAAECSEVKASVAAQVFRVTPQTIRNWVKAGIVAGRIDPLATSSSP